MRTAGQTGLLLQVVCSEAADSALIFSSIPDSDLQACFSEARKQGARWRDRH